MSIYLHKVKSRWQPGENTLAYYPLETDTNDYSGNNRNGTNNGVTFSDGLGVFNGSSYVSLGTGSWTNIQTNMTISAWFKWNGSGSQDNMVVAKTQYYAPSTSACYYNITIHAEDRYLCGGYYNGSDFNIHPLNFRTTGGGSPTLGPVAQSNKWYNVVITNDGTTKKTYIDGTLVATETNTSTSSTQSIDTRIGSAVRYNYDSYFNGNISKVIFENITWTAEEAMDYYMLTKGDYYTETQWEPNSHTLSYFPLKSNADDVIGTRGLTLGGTTISDGVANISAKTSYMLLSNTIGGTNMTASLWYYPTAFNSSGNGDWNTIFARNGGTYHHLLISGGNSDEGTVGRVGFWNNAWTGSSAILSINKWHNIIITKSGINEKIYVNGVLVLDSNSSFDNAAYQLGIIANHSNSSPSQGAHGKISEVIFEDKVWSADEVLSYYYQTRNNYVDNPWYPVKEYEVQNIYIGDIDWKPNENTLLYLPLESDVVDQSGKSGRTFTTSGLSYTTVGGVPSVHIGTTGGIKLTAPYPLQSDLTKPITVSILLYTSASSSFRDILDLAATNGERQIFCIRGNQNKVELAVYNDNNDSFYDQIYANYTNNQWTHIVYTITSSASKIYLNGQLADSGTGNPKPRGLRPYSHDNTQGIFCTRDVNSYNTGLNGNARELIMEEVEWSAQEVADYYTMIKSKLGF